MDTTRDGEPAPLLIATTTAEGRFRALTFAGCCDGDVTRIHGEIQATKRRLESGRPENFAVVEERVKSLLGP